MLIDGEEKRYFTFRCRSVDGRVETNGVLYLHLQESSVASAEKSRCQITTSIEMWIYLCLLVEELLIDFQI